MKRNLEYLIVKEEYRDSHGKLSTTAAYYIKYRSSFLGIFPIWKWVKHTECGWGDCSKVKTKFESEDDARKFISTILCKGIKIQNYEQTIVGKVNCN